MAVKNLMGKSRKPGAAYAVIELPGWKWEILKLYKSVEASKKDPYARAFCAVVGPGTFGGYDMGDVYIKDIPGAYAALEAAEAKLAVPA
jgi:hypothetical protein